MTTLRDFDPHTGDDQARQRERSLAQIQQLHTSPVLRVLSVATTGLKNAYPVAITVLGPGGVVLLDTNIYTLADIEPGAQALHGVTREALSHAPELRQVWAEVRGMLRPGNDVIAFSPKFSVDAMVRACRAEDLEMFPTGHWADGQTLLNPVCGAWNWSRMAWGRLSLADAVGEIVVPGDSGAIGTCLGNAQRLYAVLAHYAAGEAGAGHPEPDQGDLWGDAGRHEGEPVDLGSPAVPKCEMCQRALDECACFGVLERA